MALSLRVPALGAALLLSIPTISSAQQVFPNQLLKVGQSPSDLATADLNADGKLDFVTSNTGTNNLSVVLSGPSGYASAFHLPATASATSLAMADIDADGDLDAVVALPTAKSIGIFLGMGNGTFGAAIPLVVSANPTDPDKVALGDLSNDGSADVIVSMSNTSAIGVALANGAGSFGAFTFTAVGPFPRRAAVADLDTDGKLDVIVPCIQMPGWFVLLGNGLGGLTPNGSYSAGDVPGIVLAADLNQDGKVDGVGANGGFPFSFPSSISVRLGNGLGGLGAVTNYSDGQASSSLAVGDLNGDGMADAATGHGQSGLVVVHAVNVLLGNGAGAFGAPTAFPGFIGPTAIALADVNLDGKRDAAVALGQGNSVALAAGDGAGNLLAPIPVGSSGLALFADAGDLDHDGRADLLVTNYQAPNLSLFAATASGTFVFAPIPSPTMACGAAQMGDVNHDGNLDVVVVGYPASTVGQIGILLGDGNLGFANPTYVQGGSYLYGMTLFDFNADGNLDVAATGSQANPNAGLAAFLGNGASMAFLATYPTQGSPGFPIAGDFDGDAKPDLVVPNYSSLSLSYYGGTGSGGFVPMAPIPLSVQPGSFGQAADLDANGTLDLVVPSGQASSYVVLVNQGGALFTQTTYPFAGGMSCATLADVTGDGITDLLAGQNAAGTAVFLGAGSATFAYNGNYGAGASQIVANDFDGDGKLDVFSMPTIFVAGSAGVLTNLLPTPPVLVPFGVGTPGWRGTLGILANSSPKVGNSSFVITSTNVPPRSLGLVIITDKPDFQGSDPFFLGEILHNDFVTSVEFYGLDAHSDFFGRGYAPAAIPNNPFLVGKTYTAQMSWLEPPGYDCGAGLFGLVTSRGLLITIQP